MIPSDPPTGTPPWLRIARMYKGVREVIGGQLNPQIVEMFRATRYPIARLTPTTAWCAALVCHSYKKAGVKNPPHTARAADLATYGVACELKPGALVVLAPGVLGAGTSGHVGFWEQRLSDEMHWLFSGNCGNTAKSHVYPTSRFLAVRWPDEDLTAA